MEDVSTGTCWGGSSAPGTRQDQTDGSIIASQGGAFGHNALDDLDARRAAERNREARKHNLH